MAVNINHATDTITATSGTLSLPNFAGGGTVDYQEFTSTGTWTKPAGVNVVYVQLIGGGAGGGSGPRYATTSIRCGATGGWGGTYVDKLFRASDLTATVSVTVGAGGSGATAITTNSTNGITGSAGGASAFGAYLNTSTATGGVAGANTTPTVSPVGSFKAVSGNNAGSGNTTSAGFAGSGGSSRFGGGGGGSGGSANANSTTTQIAGLGGNCRDLNSSDNRATAGANAVANEGGGGGGGTYTTATTGMSGGNGAFPGGGGGGGSASDNGYDSGAGGNGAAGVVRIWSW